MAAFTIIKGDVLDDAAPVAPPGGRVFACPIFSDNMGSEFSGRVQLVIDILNVSGNSVNDAKCDVSLWLKLAGVWTKIGPTLVGIARGKHIALPFGALSAATDTYIQLVNITGTAINNVKMLADVNASEVDGPTSKEGFPENVMYGKTLAGDAVPLTVTPGGAIAIGTPTDVIVVGTLGALNATVEISTQGSGSCGVQVSAIPAGMTIAFEATVDGTNWASIPGNNPVTGVDVTTVTTNGLWVLAVAGYLKARVRVSAYLAGTANVTMESAVFAGQEVDIISPLPAGDNLIGRVKITDGTTVEKVMPASTAAAFTDPAAAVDVRPGGVFPVGAAPASGESYGTLSKIRAVLMAKTSGAATLEIVASGLSGVLSAITGVLNTQPLGKYVSTVYSLLDGQWAEFSVSSRAALRVVLDEIAQAQDDTERVFFTKDRALSSSTGAWTPYDSGTTKVGAAGLSVKSTAGRAKRFYAQNEHATNEYFLVVVDKATAAVANDAVKASIRLPAKLVSSLQAIPPILDVSDKYFTNGISVAISSTPEKVTLAGSSDCHIWGDVF